MITVPLLSMFVVPATYLLIRRRQLASRSIPISRVRRMHRTGAAGEGAWRKVEQAIRTDTTDSERNATAGVAESRAMIESEGRLRRPELGGSRDVNVIWN
jgi:hypothetical protein